jgi:hypothetical protein
VARSGIAIGEHHHHTVHHVFASTGINRNVVVHKLKRIIHKRQSPKRLVRQADLAVGVE